MFELFVEKTIAAAHCLPIAGPCSRLHGHNYQITVFVCGTRLSDAGMLVDFSEIKIALDTILARLDHTTLNDLPEFQNSPPSTENIARVIGDFLAGRISTNNAWVDRVQVRETPTQGAVYFPARETSA